MLPRTQGIRLHYYSSGNSFILGCNLMCNENDDLCQLSLQEHNPAFDIHVYGASVLDEFQKRKCGPSKTLLNIAVEKVLNTMEC